MSVEHLGRHDSWEGVRAVVAGFGASGFAAADNLNHLGASVLALDESDAGDRAEKAELLEVLGADVRLGAGATATLPDDVDLLVTSPGPTSPLLAQAAARGIPVWGEVELAWRLRDPHHDTPWLCVTGSTGTTTTVQLLDAILRAAGLRTVVVGTVGLPIVEAVMDPEPYDVLAVGLSSSQLHHTDSMSAESAAVLDVAEAHLDGRRRRRARIYERVQRACVYNVADPETERLVREADVVEGARAVGFTLGMPGVGMVGLVEDILADRAFIEQRDNSAAELCTIADLARRSPPSWPTRWPPPPWPGRTGSPRPRCATGCGPSARRHRIAAWGTDGVTWVDDSKATNPHARSPRCWPTTRRLDRRRTGQGRPSTTCGSVRPAARRGPARPDAPSSPTRFRDTPRCACPSAAGDCSMERVDDAAELARPGHVLLAPGALHGHVHNYATEGTRSRACSDDQRAPSKGARCHREPALGLPAGVARPTRWTGRSRPTTCCSAPPRCC